MAMTLTRAEALRRKADREALGIWMGASEPMTRVQERAYNRARARWRHWVMVCVTLGQEVSR